MISFLFATFVLLVGVGIAVTYLGWATTLVVLAISMGLSLYDYRLMKHREAAAKNDTEN